MTLVKIKAEEFTGPKEDAGKGLSIELSPYDIPRDVKGLYEKESGIFHIDFQYPDNEEFVPKRWNDKVTIKSGKYSGKILGFEVKVDKYDITKLALTIISAVDKQIESLQKFNEKENYKLIRSVVDKQREPIFADLHA
ncbi:MAG TPA: hypothetical protein VJ044_03200 [Candidatus Hodarchaeales archaeon]|nr:hypothetical protein [Candidatus Hodarchaeales archaeon]